MELYMDEKWRLSKKSSRINGGSLRRSEGEPFTWKGSAPGGGGGQKFSSRCASLVKEQRAKFYIMRRCVTMLICWRDYA